MFRSLAFYSLTAAFFFIIWNVLPASFHNLHLPSMASSLAGWHLRARPYHLPFSPERIALRLAVLRNAPADTQGFTLALFDSPAKIAVDAAGKVLVVQDSDFVGLVALAEQTKSLPPTNKFRNKWVIERPITSRPIERILLPISTGEGSGGENDYVQTSVQGFDGIKTHLREPVGNIHELPLVLQELVRRLLEAREVDDGDTDNSLISQVKSILGDVF